MGKRKRDITDGDATSNRKHEEQTGESRLKPSARKSKLLGKNIPTGSSTVQIVVGTYEKVLHGITATLLEDKERRSGKGAEFAVTFLFNAHASAIRCLAMSPPSSTADTTRPAKIILASGSSDQIINLYHISTSPPSPRKDESLKLPNLKGRRITENPRNRELGSLQHHNSSVNTVQFPTRSKLLSGAEDNTIAVTRTRDWTVLSTIKAPIPKAHGRPSGDTAALGDTPVGVNDFAIHPSMKLMVSVGKGEKCMRLWNLVTGKKAGVLNFERDLLQGIGEGKWTSGEGRKVEWDGLGEEFVVGFERGAAVFGMDSKPKCRILPSPSSKIHQLRYVKMPSENDEQSNVLAVSTEDGRILFYSTVSTEIALKKEDASSAIPNVQAIGQIGGNSDDLKGRIKDFKILNLPVVEGSTENLLVVAGSSDGTIRLWMLDPASLFIENTSLAKSSNSSPDDLPNGEGKTNIPKSPSIPQIGQLLGTYETGNRITCLEAFVMSEPNDMSNVVSHDESDMLPLVSAEMDGSDNMSI